MGRVDYNLTRQRIYGRYSIRRLHPRSGGPEHATWSRAEAGTAIVQPERLHSATPTTISPTLLNNFIFSYNRNNGTRFQRRAVQLARTSACTSPARTRPRYCYRNRDISPSAPVSPAHFNRQNFHFADSLHWIKGSHEIAFGGDLMKMQVDLNNTFRQTGKFRFRGTSYSGDPRSDFLVGTVERFIQGGGEYAARRGTLASLFVQDNYRVSSRPDAEPRAALGSLRPLQRRAGPHRVLSCRACTSTRFPNAPTGYLL